jgi:hypothetical protein
VPRLRGHPVHPDHPDERDDQCAARDDGQHGGDTVDESVADDGGDDADQPDDGDRPVGGKAGHLRQRLTADHCVGREEAQVHEHHEDDHQKAAVGTELGPRLQHLGNAHLRTLRGVQCHHDAADDVAEHDRHYACKQR